MVYAPSASRLVVISKRCDAVPCPTWTPLARIRTWEFGSVDEQHGAVELGRDAEREVERRERLAFRRQRARHHHEVAVLDARRRPRALRMIGRLMTRNSSAICDDRGIGRDESARLEPREVDVDAPDDRHAPRGSRRRAGCLARPVVRATRAGDADASRRLERQHRACASGRRSRHRRRVRPAVRLRRIRRRRGAAPRAACAACSMSSWSSFVPSRGAPDQQREREHRR